VQREKLEILAQIRTLVDKNTSLLDDKEKADAARLRPPDDLKLLEPATSPGACAATSPRWTGTIGRPVVYYARSG